MMADLLEVDWASVNPVLNCLPQDGVERFLEVDLGVAVGD